MQPPQLTDGQRQALNETGRAEACKRGNLRFLLHSSQLEVLEQFEATAGQFVLEKGRRWGGTWFLLVLSLMFCLRKPKSRVVYGAPTLKFLKEFVLPTLDKIALKLPEAYRPKFNAGSSHIECHNGSYIHLFGCDDQRQADTGAGSDADLAVFDEAGATGVAALLVYIMESIFEPQLMANVDRPIPGRSILGSSPPRIPEHSFVQLAELAEATGCYAHRSVLDNPRQTPEMIRALIETKARDRGMTPEQYVKSDTWRREYLAERVIDRLLVVLPEWVEYRDRCRISIARPEYFDAHVILDPGGADPHAVLFGYWHFPMAKWVIEDELLLKGNPNSETIAREIKAKESALYGTDRWDGTVRAFAEDSLELLSHLPDYMKTAWAKAAPQNPRIRWSDNNNQELCRSLFDLHGLAFVPTDKNDLEVHVNELRVSIGADEVRMLPHVKDTDRHWRSTTWANHRRKEFARRADEHGDLLACGIYGRRNLDKQRNPIPARRGLPSTLAERVGKALRG